MGDVILIWRVDGWIHEIDVENQSSFIYIKYFIYSILIDTWKRLIAQICAFWYIDLCHIHNLRKPSALYDHIYVWRDTNPFSQVPSLKFLSDRWPLYPIIKFARFQFNFRLYSSLWMSIIQHKIKISIFLTQIDVHYLKCKHELRLLAGWELQRAWILSELHWLTGVYLFFEETAD
jgi:hypothetical protein